jgi:hypothetical protein
MKKRTVTENQSIAPMPSNSGLPPFSINQITNPMNRCIATIKSHIFFVKTLMNNHISLSLSGFTVTTITSPDSIYGSVNSAYCIRSAIISVSPTAASKPCFTCHSCSSMSIYMEVHACHAISNTAYKSINIYIW